MTTGDNLQRNFIRDELEKFVVRSRAAKRKLMWRFCSGPLPLYLIPEFPKSGGTWFSQMLSECLELPLFRNTTAQKFCSSVMSGHELYHPAFRNVTVVFRDGRDVMVSAYFHWLFKNDINKMFGVVKHRKALNFADYDDTRANMPAFIEYMFNEFCKGRHFSWAQFVDSWLPHIDDHVTYERLLADPAEELDRTVRRLTGRTLPAERISEVVEKFSFKKQSGRKRGQSKKGSFVRKGIAGDWKNHFTSEACHVFNQYAGGQLRQLGYETSDDWIEMRESKQAVETENQKHKPTEEANTSTTP